MPRLPALVCSSAIICAACGGGDETIDAVPVTRPAAGAFAPSAADTAWTQRSPDGLPAVAAEDAKTAGRYVAVVAGCNWCHTEAWLTEAEVPEAHWMSGNPIGFEGAWGVSFASNLRLVVQEWSEGRWVETMHHDAHASMPWIALEALSEKDVRAVYRYLKELGPVGEPTPDAIPAGEPITEPYRTLRLRAPGGAPEGGPSAEPRPDEQGAGAEASEAGAGAEAVEASGRPDAAGSGA